MTDETKPKQPWTPGRWMLSGPVGKAGWIESETPGTNGTIIAAMSETDDVKRPWDHGADYYSTSDQDERLTHTTLDECLEAHFGEDRTTWTTEGIIFKGVTVYAWRRAAIDLVAEATSSLNDFVVELAESIADEYGDPDEGWRGGIATKDADEFKAIVMPALVTLLATVKPWRCHVVGQRTFTADELLAWVREHNPKWLEGRS